MREYYWVVCGVFQKKRKPKRHNSKRKQMIREGPPTPSFSCSSGITEVSFDGGLEDDQEESSANINHCSNPYTEEPN